MKEMHNRKFAALVLLGLMLLQAGCARQGGKTTDKVDEPSVVENTEQVEVLGQTEVEQVTPKINIFIENSASMDGYIKGFKPAIKNLVVDLKRDYAIGLNFVNNTVYPQTIAVNQDPIDVVSKMFDIGFTKVGNRRTTKLNEIIKMVLDQTNDSTVSILVSDCIYSIKDSKKTTNEDRLKDLMVETKNQFVNKYSAIDDLSVLFIRLKAKFTGQYYDFNDAPITLNDYDRPYYMCVIGTDKNIRQFMKNISIDELEGYTCHYYLSGKDLSNTYYAAISKPYGVGIFPIEDVHVIKPRNSSSIQFAVAVNLNDFPMAEEEKLNLENYSIDSTYTMRIETIDDKTLFMPKEKQSVIDNGGTHLLVVSSKGYPTDFIIKVRRTVPKWVEDFSSINDTNMKGDNLEKTFGVSYFINGVADAFRTNSRDKDSYFTMYFKIKH